MVVNSFQWVKDKWHVGSITFPPGALQASRYHKHSIFKWMTLPFLISKINNIYVDTSSSFCLVIFVRTRLRFLYRRIKFQINMSICQLTQHGFIRHMRNDTHKHLQVLKTDTHEVTFQKQFAWPFHRTYK